jgi:hypothetical protein
MSEIREDLLHTDTLNFAIAATQIFFVIEEDGWEDLQSSLISAGLTCLHKLVEPTPNSWLSVLTAYNVLKDEKDMQNIANLPINERYYNFMAFLKSCVAAYENGWYSEENLKDAGEIADAFDQFQEKENN